MGAELIIAGASLLVGAASAGHQMYEAKKQRKLQKEQAEQQEALAKAQAGQTPEEQQAEALEASEADRKSALRRTILTKSTSSGGTKLGD